MFLNPTIFFRRIFSFFFFFFFFFFTFVFTCFARYETGRLREDGVWGIYEKTRLGAFTVCLYSGGVDNVFSFPCSCFYYFSGHEKG